MKQVKLSRKYYIEEYDKRYPWYVWVLCYLVTMIPIILLLLSAFASCIF